MFNGIPTRVWLLVVFGVAAYAPAAYIIRYLSHSPSRRDITQPDEDWSWRTGRQLAISLVALSVLTGLSIFIFTQAAVNFSRSPSFWSIVIALLAAFATYASVKGLIVGSVTPAIRGSFGPYERNSQPVRYWLSMFWNAGISGALFYTAFAFPFDQQDVALSPGERRCFDSDRENAEEALVACTALLDQQQRDSHYRAEIFNARGQAHHLLFDYQLAAEDYSEAIRLDGRDRYSYFNRALIALRLGEKAWALRQMTAVERLRAIAIEQPDNYQSLYDADTHFANAIADFSQAIQLAPDDARAYCLRAVTYQYIGKARQAITDTAKATKLDPKMSSPSCSSG